MNIKELKERISDLPDDHKVVLSKLFVVDVNDGKSKEEDWYQVVLDCPMCGIAISDKDKEIRFMVDMNRGSKTLEKEKEFWKKNFGDIKKLD